MLMAGEGNYAVGVGPLKRAARAIHIEKEISKGLIGQMRDQGKSLFSPLLKDSWQKVVKEHLATLSKGEWMTIYKAHPVLREMDYPTEAMSYKDVITNLRGEGLYGGSRGVTHFINNVLKARSGQILKHIGNELPDQWDELRLSQVERRIPTAILEASDKGI